MAEMTLQPPGPPSKGTIIRYVRYREAVEAAQRLQTGVDGVEYVVRFTPGQRIEHQLLIFSFTTLTVTGLVQTFYDTPVGAVLLTLLGGLEGARIIHHAAAVVFILQSIYHLARFANDFIVYRRVSQMFPSKRDLTDLVQMLKLNLGFSRRHPQFDRYTFEEKAEYWALIWGGAVMVLTGLMQWFPVLVTRYLPGWSIPAARALHKWEAILAALAIVTWHFYHVMIKTRNTSIFSGMMSIEQMEEEHPLELQYLRKAAAALRENTWPARIEIIPEEGHAHTPPEPVDIATAQVPREETGIEDPDADFPQAEPTSFSNNDRHLPEPEETTAKLEPNGTAAAETDGHSAPPAAPDREQEVRDSNPEDD